MFYDVSNDKSDGVPPLQGGRNMAGEYPGLRSQTRSSLGYNLTGFQPWVVGGHEDGLI